MNKYIIGNTLNYAFKEEIKENLKQDHAAWTWAEKLINLLFTNLIWLWTKGIAYEL